MSIREFVAAIPKLDLNLQLTGALVKDSLLMIARQNGVPAEMSDFDEWVNLLDNPDYDRLDEIAAMTGSWVKYPEDIARVVYDIGVVLSKQNVIYAEICVAPSEFMNVQGMNIETFLGALNDGRDRALRGWGVDMSWILCIPRHNPRAGDDVARWATGTTARQGNVVAIGLIGQEDAQPVGQFKRAFATARKKEVFTIAHAGSNLGLGGIMPALEELDPHRLTDSWGIVDDAAMPEMLAAAGIPLVLSISRALRLGLISSAEEYPLRRLLDSNLQVALSAGMPTLYQSSLVDEYALAHEECGLSTDEIIELARQSIQVAFLDAERKQELLDRFSEQVPFAKATLLES